MEELRLRSPSMVRLTGVPVGTSAGYTASTTFVAVSADEVFGGGRVGEGVSSH